jgi:hypothetical protein
MPRQLPSLKRSNIAVLYILMGFMVTVGLSTLVISHADSVNYFDNPYVHVSPLSVTVTLSRSNPNYALMSRDKSAYATDLLYGRGFTITDKTATSFEIRNTLPTQGVGLYESSGGLTPGHTVNIHTYASKVTADGTYTGSATLFYYAPDQKTWVSGPTVAYAITLTN